MWTWGWTIVARWDEAALHACAGAHGAWLAAMIGLGVLGGPGAVLLVPFLFVRRTRRLGTALVAAVAAQASLVWFLKRAFGRLRPWLAESLAPSLDFPSWRAPHDGSFPSGHAAGSFCVAAFLAVVLPTGIGRNSRIRATLVRGALVAAAGLIGFSRVVLGLHFPSDVVAGSVLGGSIGFAAGRLYLASGEPVRPHS